LNSTKTWVIIAAVIILVIEVIIYFENWYDIYFVSYFSYSLLSLRWLYAVVERKTLYTIHHESTKIHSAREKQCLISWPISKDVYFSPLSLFLNYQFEWMNEWMNVIQIYFSYVNEWLEITTILFHYTHRKLYLLFVCYCKFLLLKSFFSFLL